MVGVSCNSVVALIGGDVVDDAGANGDAGPNLSGGDEWDTNVSGVCSLK